MSHIHIPDGVLPTWLWAAGWIGAIVLVWIASAMAGRSDVRRKVPLLGVTAALVLVSMSSEIVPIAYHVNLTVVAGVILGPWLGAIASFIVVVVLALLGHGGVTVIGLNTLVIASEMALGWALFRAFTAMLGRPRVRVSAALATVLALATTTAMLVGIVALSGAGEAGHRETGAFDPATLRFENPLAGGLFSVNTLRGEEHEEQEGPEAPEGPAPSDPAPDPAPPDEAPARSPVERFALLVFVLGPIGWALEAAVTAALLGYVARVRPSLIFDGAVASRGRAVVGDEGVR